MNMKRIQLAFMTIIVRLLYELYICAIDKDYANNNGDGQEFIQKEIERFYEMVSE